MFIVHSCPYASATMHNQATTMMKLFSSGFVRICVKLIGRSSWLAAAKKNIIQQEGFLEAFEVTKMYKSGKKNAYIYAFVYFICSRITHTNTIRKNFPILSLFFFVRHKRTIFALRKIKENKRKIVYCKFSTIGYFLFGLISIGWHYYYVSIFLKYDYNNQIIKILINK